MFLCIGILLSKQSITRRVRIISDENLSQLKTKLNDCAYYSLALDESTDINDMSQLLIFIRIINDNFKAAEGLLSCVAMHCTTKGVDIFDV